MHFRLASHADLPVLARIHKAAYSRNHFTSLLPVTTLISYYGQFLHHGSEILLAIHGDNIVGFSVYGTDVPKRIAAFKKTAVPSILLTSIRHPFISLRKFSRAFITRVSSRPSFAPATFLLLSIAVLHPRRGTGSLLLHNLYLTARQRGESILGLYVNADNISAINVYFSAGFVMRHYRSGQFYMEKNLDE